MKAHGMTRFATLACAALVVELAPVHADSKNDVVGFSPNHVFEQVLAGENVDVLSGNLNLEIPIGANFQVAENLDYQLKLYYNSKVWEHLCPKYLPVGEYCHGHFALPTTWGLGFNLWFGRIHRNEVQTYPNGFDEVVEPPDKSNVYRYQTPDGADHYFCAGSSCVGQNPAGVSTGFGSGITLDGSGIRVEGSAAAGWTVYPGDGTKILFNHYVGSSDRRLFGWYASRIETILTKTSGAQAGQPVGFIDIAYLNTGSTRLDSITDSTGRTIDFEWTQIAGQYTECKIKLPAMSGTADYVFKFAPAMFEDPIDLDRGGSPAPTTLAATVLTQIDYPHDSGPFLNYKFEYEDSGLTYPYGYLSKRILPTGASVAYDYGHYSAGDKRPFRVELRYKTLTLSSLLPGGGDYRWSYARFGDGVIRTRAELDAFRNVEVGGYRPSNPNVVYVLDPFDNMTEHRFEYTESLTSDTVPDSAWDDGMLVQTKLFAGPLADGSRLVQSTQYEYVHEGVFQYKSISQSDYCPDWINWQTQCLPPYQSIPVNSRRVRETTTVPGSGSIPGKIARVEYSDWPSIAGLTPVWSQLSESRRADVYDNDRLVRTTYTDLAPTKEWHGTHRYVETRNASGVATSRSERRYTLDRLDCEVRRATPSVPMASGPLDCDAALTTGDVKVRPTYDSTTGRRTATTVSGGDDGASLLTNEERDVAGNLLRSKFGSLTWFATDRTIHVGTGLVTSSLSPDGGQTSYTWDKLGRLTKVDPPGIETDTTIAYPNLKQTVVTRNGGTNRLIETTYTYDELGRNTEIRKSNATGWKDFQRMRYDVSGRMVRRSEWAAFVSYPEVADSALKWTDIDFTLTEDANGATGAADRYPDPLGRVHKITAPDGATTLTDYEGNDTIVSVPGIQGSNGILESKTRYRRDGLDRLISVSSPGTGADAFYRYDDQDRLTWVDLVDPVDPLRSQHREFTYDALGRLRLASNPENGMTSYLKYDARGNLLEYQDAMAFRFVNAFDVAGRLVNRSVRVGAATKQLEANIYDTLAGFNAGPSAGKLVERRSNSLTRHAAGAWMSTLVVSDRFHYGPTGTSSPVNCPVTGGGFAGLNGRVDWQQSDFTMLGTPFRTDFCQDVLGFDSALSYPATTEVPPTRVRAKLTYTNRNGYLFSVRDAGRGVDLVTATEYAPGGIPTRITRASGVIDTTELDVRNRPSRIRVLGQPVNPPVENVIWDSGAYSYDGAGNVTGIGVDSYRYDEMNRIVGATVTSGITSHALAYSYDAFGNMLSSGKSSVSGGGAPVTLLKTFDVDIHNNQLRQESRTNLAGTTQTTFTFDSIGNLAASVTEAGGRVYGFDPAGRLERVTDESAGVLGSYAYDASGNRVSNTANGVETYFLRDSGGRVLSEFRRLVGTIDPVGWNKDYVYAFGKAFTLIQNDIPTAPEAPWATNVTTTGLVLNWKPVNDPDLLGYGIERHWYPDPIAHPGLDMYEEAANLTVPAGTTSYTTAYPQTPGANTYAEYRVYALDTAANPSASSPVLKVRPNATAPPAITGLKYHPLNQAVRFVWNPVPQNDIWGYRIQRKGPYGDEWTLLTPSPIPGVEYVDSGLINGEGYVYLFNAVDTAGRIGAGFKTQNAIVPRDTIPPSPPTALTAQPSWDNPWHIVLNWIPPGDSDLAKLTDNFEVRAFKILRSTGPIADDGTATPPPYEYEITEREIPRSDNVPAVPNGTALPTYYYRVKARDFSGNWSALSVQASAKPLRPCAAITSLQGAFETNDNGTPASTVPNPPTYSWCQISEENDDIVSVRLSWQPPAGTTGVTVYRAELGSTEFQPITGELLAGGTSWRDASVQSAGYQYRVQPTISGVPAGECSASTMITVNERITPSVRNTTAEDSAADFPWDANKRSRWIKVR